MKGLEKEGVGMSIKGIALGVINQHCTVRGLCIPPFVVIEHVIPKELILV